MIAVCCILYVVVGVITSCGVGYCGAADDTAPHRHLAVLDETIFLPGSDKTDSISDVQLVVWLKDTQKIMQQSSFDGTPSTEGRYTMYAEFQDTAGSLETSLEIRNISFSDAGSYTCEIYYHEKPLFTIQHKIQVQGYPWLAKDKEVYTEGQMVSAMCCANSSRAMTDTSLDWSTQHGAISTKVETGTIPIVSTDVQLTCSNLTFHATRLQHQQKLTCMIRNERNLSADTNLFILYSASVQISVLNSTNTDDTSTSIEEYAIGIIVCEADGNPPANVTLQKQVRNEGWTRQLHLPTVQSRDGWNTSWTFYLYNISRLDAGVYRCEAFNGLAAPRNSEQHEIDVLFSTHTILTSANVMNVGENDDFYIDCATESNPVAVVTIEKIVNIDEWVDLSEKPFLISNDGFKSTWRFYFSKASLKVAGTYRCLGFNGVGVKTASLSILVEIKDEKKLFGIKITDHSVTIVIVIASILLLLLVIILIAYIKRRNHRSVTIPDELYRYLSVHSLSNLSYANTLASIQQRDTARYGDTSHTIDRNRTMNSQREAEWVSSDDISYDDDFAQNRPHYDTNERTQMDNIYMNTG
ncbi:uncharacterized protein [Apostichopus japonicus]|uniref:uncharacterized protein isoform X2 n=1 Tax=Stichopus japonicus TaxID=307972 RepID=UPI003AB7AE11